MKTFLQPLTLEEEKEYLQKYQRGDPHARDVLIERNLRLVAHVARKYQNAGDDPDDLISIGTIGLIKAVSTFDASKGNRLATYAARCIDNELLMMLRTKKKTSREVSLYEPIGTDKEGNEINLLDIIECPLEDMTASYIKKAEIQRLYDSALDVLSSRERVVICLRYGLHRQKERTQKEVAVLLGISRSYVSRIEKAAIHKLRLYFLHS